MHNYSLLWENVSIILRKTNQLIVVYLGLQHLRMLKSIVLNAHNVLACNSLGENATEQPQTFEKIKESIDKYAQQMNSEYE
jgi:hypothetical protein